MKRYCFLVTFITGQNEQVRAFDKTEAIILAQAKQIEKCNEYRYISDVFIID